MNVDPLVVLHDHLDGGVRPATVLELAQRYGVATPADSAAELADWFTVNPSMDLVEAFSRFDLVGAVTQTAEALRRIAREAVEDLAADGVVHAELRFAPLLHTLGDLDPGQVIDAVAAGLDDGEAATGLDARLIVCAMRHEPVSTSISAIEAAIAGRGRRVVGVDLAGGEPGHLAEDHAEAFARAHDAGLGVTIHAGEMDGPHQVESALRSCAPHRIGHGWRVIDDCEVSDGRIVSLGPTASALRDAAIPLEICITSNAALGLAVEQHPAKMLLDAGFRVTLNPDDRAITTTTARRELTLAEALGFSRADLAATQERAAVAAFVTDAERAELVTRVRHGWYGDGLDPHTMLVHLAERDRWEQRGSEAYLPAEFGRDGFIHLSALHQVLGPANAFYRGRTDLVALVVHGPSLGAGLVWEPGTGTHEWFPHLYGALDPSAVAAAVDFPPSPDGSFLRPTAIDRAVSRGR